MPELSPTAQMLLPLFLHFGLVVGLYMALTWARLMAVRRGEVTKAEFARADGDPPVSARIRDACNCSASLVAKAVARCTCVETSAFTSALISVTSR